MIYPLLLNLLAVFALGYAHAEMIKGLFYYETTDRYIYICPETAKSRKDTFKNK